MSSNFILWFFLKDQQPGHGVYLAVRTSRLIGNLLHLDGISETGQESAEVADETIPIPTVQSSGNGLLNTTGDIGKPLRG
jgi:hypothetical protein